MRDAVYHHPAHATNALAAVVVKRHRLLALRDELLVEYVEHL
jgi:hypothetical protein